MTYWRQLPSFPDGWPRAEGAPASCWRATGASVPIRCRFPPGRCWNVSWRDSPLAIEDSRTVPERLPLASYPGSQITFVVHHPWKSVGTSPEKASLRGRKDRLDANHLFIKTTINVSVLAKESCPLFLLSGTKDEEES